MLEIDSILQSINEQIDGEQLARLIDYHPDKIRSDGKTLKCFCPVHREMAFRSLIFYLKQHNYKCMMKQCELFEGGTFVEFWSIFKRLEPIEAALDLAERLKLDVDVGRVRLLGEEFAIAAREALEQARYDEAHAKIQQALAFDVNNLQLRLLSAQIHEARGDVEAALAERYGLYEYHLGQHDLDLARTVLDDIRAHYPPSPELFRRRVELAERQGDTDGIQAVLIELSEYQEKQGDIQAAAAALEDALARDTENTDVLDLLARFHHRHGNRKAERQTLERLAVVFEGQTEARRLLGVLDRLLALNPDDLSVRERIAAAMARSGQTDSARKQWLAIARSREEQGLFAEAEQIVARLLVTDPESVDLLEVQARLLNESGRRAEAVRTYRQLAALARDVEMDTRVNEYYELARAIDPGDLGLRKDLAEWKLVRGDLEGGLNELFNLADFSLANGHRAEGMAILTRIATLAPTDLDKRLRIGRCLERNGLADEAFASYSLLVRDLMKQQQFDAAQAICEEVRRLRPGDTETLVLRIETHLALDQKNEAIEACREFARERMVEDDFVAAEAALERGIRIDRTEKAAKTDLAQLYEQTGRARRAAALWIEIALFERAQGQTDAANGAVREALRLDPQSNEARVMLAEGLEAAGEIREASELWKQILVEQREAGAAPEELHARLLHLLSLAPRDHQVLGELAPLSLRLEGAEAALPYYIRWLEAQGLAEEMMSAYGRAVEAYPNQQTWRRRLAAMLMEAGREEEASEHLEKLLEGMEAEGRGDEEQHLTLEQLVALKPERHDLRAQLARSLARQGQAHEAARMFEEIADLRLRDGDLDQGIALMKEALEAAPGNHDLLERTAGLIERAGRMEDALELYERLAELNRRKSERARSIPILEKLLAYQPERLELRAEIAELYEAEGDIDRALEEYLTLARAFNRQDSSPQRVVELCQRIRGLMPECIEARELLVESWLKQGHTAGARQELEQLGDWALSVNDLQRAEGFYRRIQEIEPGDIGNGERLARLYEASGRDREAQAAYQHVLELYEQAGEGASAIRVLHKLRDLDEENLELRLRLARALLNEPGQRREAAEEWLALIERCGEQAPERLTALLDEALPSFRTDWDWRQRVIRLLSLQPDYEGIEAAWETLARDALEAREGVIAREAAAEGLRRNPDSLVLRRLRVDANRALSNYDLAIDDLRELAEHAGARNDYEGAAALLREGLELQPRNGALLRMLAEAQLAAGHTAEGRASLTSLIALHEQEGDFEQAIQRARQLVRISGQSPESRDALAVLLMKAGQTRESVEEWCRLAEELAESGQEEAAMARYLRILEYLPGDVEILRRLADLCYDTGGMVMAMGHYDRLLDAMQASCEPAAVEAEILRILELESGHLALKERLAEFLQQQGRTEESRRVLREIFATYRDERGEHRSALRVLRQLKKLDPSDTQAQREEAELLEATGNAREAAQVWQLLALEHRQRRNLAEAAACADRAAALLADRPELQLEAAGLYEDLDDIERATECYLRAVAVHEAQGHHGACIAILERLVEINPRRHDLPERLARLLEAEGQTDQAGRVWLSLGQREESAGRLLEARRIYQHLRQLLPDSVEPRRRLARICEREGDRPGAIVQWRELAELCGRRGENEWEAEFLQHLLELDPRDPAALERLATLWRDASRPHALYDVLDRLESLHRAAGRFDLALRTLEEMKGLRPKEPDLQARAVELLLKTGREEEGARQALELIAVWFEAGEDSRALEMLRRVAEINPNDIERRIMLARMIHDHGRIEAARQEFFLTSTKLFGEMQWEACRHACEAGLELFENDVRLRDLLGRALIKLGRRGEAIESQLHLATLYEERGEAVRAQRVYESILEMQPDHLATLEAMVEWALRHDRPALAVDNLLRLSEAHYLAGDLERATRSMEQIARIDPNRAELMARLAELYLEGDRPEDARRTWIESARHMLREGRYDAAVEALERCHKHDPDSLEVHIELVHAYAQADRLEDYRREGLRLAGLCRDRGEIDRALEVYRGLTEYDPHDLMAWEHLAELLEAQGLTTEASQAHYTQYELHRAARRPDRARLCLERALALQPDSLVLLETLGELCLAQGRRAEGLTHLAQAATQLHHDGHHPRAIKLAERILKLEPDNLEIVRLRAHALQAEGDLTGALEGFIQAARGLSETHENDAAIEVLEELLALAPELHDQRELYARVLRRQGRVRESVEQYLKLIASLGPDDDPRKAIRFCRQILTDSPDEPAAHACLCDVYARCDKPRQAYQECLWLARHHREQKNLAEAERYVELGLGWFPDDLGLRRELVDILLAAGRTADASVQLGELARVAEARADAQLTIWAMEKASELEPDNVEHRRRLADQLERGGDAEGARRTRIELIRRMLDLNLMDDARRLAEQVASGLSDEDPRRREIGEIFEAAGLPEVAAYHFHLLARGYATAGKLDQARSLAGRVLELKPRHVGAREILIEVLLGQSERAAAAEQYEKLAEIYSEAGQWEGALRTLEALIELIPDRTRPRLRLAELYERLQREDALAEQLWRLVELYSGAGRKTEAVECLRRIIEHQPENTQARLRYIEYCREEASPTEMAEAYQELANLYARKGAVDKAAEMYEQLTALDSRSTEGRDQFIQFLLAQGDIDRALEQTVALLDLLEEGGRTAEAVRVVERAINYAPQATDLRHRLARYHLSLNRRGVALETFRSLARQYEQAGDVAHLVEVLKSIVDIDPLSVEHRQRLAELYHRRGQDEAAVEHYERLAEQYLDGGLSDLAEHTLRRVLALRPGRSDLWERVIAIHQQEGRTDEALADLIMLADLYMEEAQLEQALTTYKRILELDPDNIEVLNLYIDLSLQMGPETVVVDEMLRLADLRARRGEAREAMSIYRHLMELCPHHEEIKERMSATQTLVRDGGALKTDPAGSTLGILGASDPNTVTKLIRNYENILRLNTRNPAARAKLAELMERAGQHEEADRHWLAAAEDYVQKGNLERALEICGHQIERHPDDPRMREMQSRIMVQRDSMRIIDGALSDELDKL